MYVKSHCQVVNKLIVNLLTLVVPPYIELSPNLDEVDMDIGEKIILQCDAEGKPVPDVMWMLPEQSDIMVSVYVKKKIHFMFVLFI